MAAEQAENPLAMLIVKRAESTTLMSKSGDFMWFQIFIDLLIRMDQDEDALKELISFCKTIYQDNEAQLHSIEEFERTYESSNAILWYTKATFLYRLLNKALRIQSFHTIVAFRAFIRDISKQLQFEHEQQKEQRKNEGENVIIAYRGQAVSIQEFNEFRNSIHDYFTINSFLSATLNRDIAKMYVVSALQNDLLMSILIEIEADMSQNTKAFAYVAHLSQFPPELEILFMIGSTFRIRSVHQNVGENYYTVNLVLCSENDMELKDTFNINTLRENYPEQHPDIATCLSNIGLVCRNVQEYDLAEELQLKALDIRIQTLPAYDIDIARSYHNLGILYENLNDFQLALYYYQEAMDIKTQCLSQHSPEYQDTFQCLVALRHKIKSVSSAAVCWKSKRD
ncbi:unnamed protein product, partial [Rotaria sp. Silwood1]